MAYQWKEQLDRLMKNGAAYADVRYYPKDDSQFMVMLNGNMLGFERGHERLWRARVGGRRLGLCRLQQHE